MLRVSFNLKELINEALRLNSGLAKGLYKGFIANVVRSVGGALVLVFYDRAKNYLGIAGAGGDA